MDLCSLDTFGRSQRQEGVHFSYHNCLTSNNPLSNYMTLYCQVCYTIPRIEE